ncbi:hypothetical protein G9A89_020209 [Geosiphon pyriformis]|nr:hypothetical protein G9A89_020209 [Geosiphon pyriformis]
MAFTSFQDIAIVILIIACIGFFASASPQNQNSYPARNPLGLIRRYESNVGAALTADKPTLYKRQEGYEDYEEDGEDEETDSEIEDEGMRAYGKRLPKIRYYHPKPRHHRHGRHQYHH